MERQVGKLAYIRADHVNRYRLACSDIPQGVEVLDLGCGCGYGAWLLHQSGHSVTAVDIHQPSIVYARENYAGPQYICANVQALGGPWEWMVAFEILEHLAEPLQVLKKVWARHIICSVPNEDCLPFVAEHFKQDEYPHLRHYKPVEFDQLLMDAGYAVRARYAQRDKSAAPELGTEGMTLVYEAHRI